MRSEGNFKNMFNIRTWNYGKTFGLKCWDFGIHLEGDEVCYIELTVNLFRCGFSIGYVRPKYRENS